MIRRRLLAAGVLGHCLGSLADSVLSEFTREKKTDSSLDFPTGDGRLLVVVCQAAGLGSNALEDVVDKRVHDAHGLAGDTSVGVDLLQDLVDVDRVGLTTAAVASLLLTSIGDGLLGGLAASGTLSTLGSRFRRHLEIVETT